MPHILVASTNPVKIQAARDGFQRMFPTEVYTSAGLPVPSGVADQPMTSAETLQGAFNRARSVQRADDNADYWVGIEGGCEDVAGDLLCFAWVVVLSREREGKGQTGTFVLPLEVAELVRQGVELGEADDRVFGRSNSKHSNGAIGLLSGDVVDRVGYYVHAMIMALVPFKNPHLNFGASKGREPLVR
jgi:inosine/xanthosine triphosphatase